MIIMQNKKEKKKLGSQAAGDHNSLANKKKYNEPKTTSC